MASFRWMVNGATGYGGSDQPPRTRRLAPCSAGSRLTSLLCRPSYLLIVQMVQSYSTTSREICMMDDMLRPASWTGLAGGSPVPVSTGAPGSRPRFVAERRRAKRGVESLFGGSKCAGRSAVRRESCSLVIVTMEEPSRSCHGEGLCLSSPGPGSARRVLPGYGERHVQIVQSGTGEARLLSLRRAKTRGISRW
jgi:hypothetical protein